MRQRRSTATHIKESSRRISILIPRNRTLGALVFSIGSACGAFAASAAQVLVSFLSLFTYSFILVCTKGNAPLTNRLSGSSLDESLTCPIGNPFTLPLVRTRFCICTTHLTKFIYLSLNLQLLLGVINVDFTLCPLLVPMLHCS